jgi:hypothetical protein
MRMRAKMEVASLQRCYPNGITVVLAPVTGGSDENRRFFAATPNGRVELGLSAAAAQSLGISTAMIGKEFYLDLLPVAPEPQIPGPPTPPTPPGPPPVG